MRDRRRARHSRFPTVYYRCLLVLFGSVTALSIMRWADDYHLFVLAALSIASAYLGRMALRRRWRGRFKLHLTGMGLSYIPLVVAFYVDNVKQLPIWKDFPTFTYWLLPFAVGTPSIMWTLFRRPVVSRNSGGFR